MQIAISSFIWTSGECNYVCVMRQLVTFTLKVKWLKNQSATAWTSASPGSRDINFFPRICDSCNHLFDLTWLSLLYTARSLLVHKWREIIHSSLLTAVDTPVTFTAHRRATVTILSTLLHLVTVCHWDTLSLYFFLSLLLAKSLRWHSSHAIPCK